jgi:hypothetical protein
MPADFDRDDEIGRRYGLLTVLAEAPRYQPPSGGVYRRCWCLCACGQETIARLSDLRRGQMLSCGCRKRTLSPVVKYRSAHQRVDRIRGLASSHPCVDCGDQAQAWSYNHKDPYEVYEVRRRDGRVLAYSTNPDAYEPRCRSCHASFDHAHSKARR